MNIDIYTLFAVLHTLKISCNVLITHGQIYLTSCWH